MAIAIMIGKGDSLSGDKIPFIPEKVDEFAARVSALASQDTAFSPHELYSSLSPDILLPRENKSKETSRYMKTPIVLAALLSPIYLLLPVNLITVYVGKLDTLMTSKRIGNTKPRALQHAERQVWKALFAISTGRKAPLNALLECFDEIDWADIESVDSLGWFSDGFDGESMPVLHSVNDFHLAAAIPPSWPSLRFLTESRRIEEGNDSNGQIEPQTENTLSQPEDDGSVNVPVPADIDASTQNENAPLTPNANAGTREEPDTDGSINVPAPADVDPSTQNKNAPLTPNANVGNGADISANGDTNQGNDLAPRDAHQSANNNGGTVVPTSPKDNRENTDGQDASDHHDGDGQEKPDESGDSVTGNEPQQKDTNPSKTPKKPKSKKKTGHGKRKGTPNDHRGKATDRHSRSVTVQPTHANSRDLPAPPDILESQALDKIIEIIDLDIIQSGRPEPSLDIGVFPSKISHPKQPNFAVYTPRGKAVPLTPKLHTVEEVQALIDMANAAEKDSSENGIPFFICQPTKSVFRIMTEDESTRMHGAQLMQLLASNILIITDCAVEEVAFDEGGLSELKDLEAVVSVHDCSILPKKGSYVERSKQTTLGHVLECSRNPNGKILNVLDLPLGWKGAIPTPFSSETRAWMATEGLPYCKTPLPADALRWALAATAGAHHSWHIDANGFGAKILVGCGGKLLFVGRPRAPDAFENVNMFINNMDTYSPCTERWDVEAIYLEPGDAIILPPNMPHSVYTADHLICFGGHFFTSFTMKNTLVAVIHNFFCYHISTNTDHFEWRDFIHRITTFFHHTIVTGTVIGAFNVQLARHEQFDLNTMTGFDRRKCVHHRSLAWDIVHHIDAKYRAENRSTGISFSIFDNIFLPFISHLCKASLNYRMLVLDQGVKSFVDLSNDDYEKQMRACFHEHPEILEAINNSEGIGNLIFSFDFDCKLSLATEFASEPLGPLGTFLLWCPVHNF
ncbi:hypothetical protein GALMADRAFT_219157 [Galerina marginata CBS 339.88]|uniref:JmjC domain-containing protein n=1 Tax=Galerina marginata (strain CBS 339.88) TaxID=685588 RepID=A0A067TSI4_GALM3|nr:hypothetical protein GALMADRAFT_219157 [Galerina marginata CBS 339.88]